MRPALCPKQHNRSEGKSFLPGFVGGVMCLKCFLFSVHALWHTMRAIFSLLLFWRLLHLHLFLLPYLALSDNQKAKVGCIYSEHYKFGLYQNHALRPKARAMHRNGRHILMANSRDILGPYKNSSLPTLPAYKVLHQTL